MPDTVTAPCAIVQPGSPVVEYHQAFGNGLERYVFKIMVLAQRFDEAANQTLLDGFLSGSGSVRALIEGDITLGGSASTCEVVSCDMYGLLEINEAAFLALEFTTEVYA
tara:strand:+ start:819 stop:1145 length:327 start_codon:yes stop_codon:yes gene_type:complete